MDTEMDKEREQKYDELTAAGDKIQHMAELARAMAHVVFDSITDPADLDAMARIRKAHSNLLDASTNLGFAALACYDQAKVLYPYKEGN